MVTQQELKAKYRYCQDKGLFYHIAGPKAGGVCGVMRPDGYIKIDVNKKSYLAHRMAYLYMTGAFPANVIDHINGIKHDNRWENIRAVTQQQNSCNQRKMRTGKTSIYKGVSWDAARGLWYAYIRHNGKMKNLGCYARECNAAQVYNFYAESLFGEFAGLSNGAN